MDAPSLVHPSEHGSNPSLGCAIICIPHVFHSHNQITVPPQRMSVIQIQSWKHLRTRGWQRQQRRWETLCPEPGSPQASAPDAAQTQNGVSAPSSAESSRDVAVPTAGPLYRPASWFVTMLMDQRHGSWEKHEGTALLRESWTPQHHSAEATSQHSPITQPSKFSWSPRQAALDGVQGKARSFRRKRSFCAH